MRVLFLPKWYPDRDDPMPGLFIRRQAEALTPWCDVAVVYVRAEADCPNAYEAEFSEENEVRVLRVYYRADDRKPGLAGKLVNFWKYYRATRKAIHSIRQFSPDLVHAHILTRIAWMGLRVSRRQHIPLVVSEHWSRYFPENNTYSGWLRKWLTRCVVKRTSALIAVSEPLRDAMIRCGISNPRFRVVPNVVPGDIFRPKLTPEENSVVTMVHISCFEDRSKNISGFLRSIKELSASRQDFRCLLVGEGPDFEAMRSYAGTLGILDSFVFFEGIKTEYEIGDILASADFSVLSSRYETFGTVVIESLACGIPVVATAVGVAPGLIGEMNGMLVPPGDEAAMTAALDRMVGRCRSYDHRVISSGVLEKYSRETVGNEILAIYREVL